MWRGANFWANRASLGRQKEFGHHCVSRRDPVVPGTLVGEIDDAARKFLEESVANFAAEEKFVGMTVERESKPA